MKIIRQPPRKLWQQVVDRSPEATFFHTPTWSNIIVQTYPQFKTATMVFELADGQFALLPCVALTERNRLFSWWESLYLGSYGGLIGERPLAQGEVDEIYSRVLNWQVAKFHLIGNPYSSNETPSFFESEPLTTQVIDLKDGYEAVQQRFAKNRRGDLKKASQQNIEIYIAESELDFHLYYEIYQDTLRRWGDSTLVSYEPELFQNIYRQGSPAIRLWLARVDGKTVCGKLVFYHKQVAYYWHAAALEDFLHTQADPYLMAHIIEDACNSGYQTLDMGPSGGLVGVEKYKERFGAISMPFLTSTWQSNHVYQAYRQFITK